MTPEPYWQDDFDRRRWEEIEALFHQALERDAGERAAFLAAACGGDEALCRRITKLLEGLPSDESLPADDSLEARVGGALRGLSREEESRDAGTFPRRLGAYEVLRQIGQGGSGTVFLARRADEQYELLVAIKVVRHNLGYGDLGERLRRERQILAGLDHPHIARFLEGGTTDDGLPYFVMQYIEGEPIDLYCDRRGLGLGERLDLFRKVCAAVHHAHRNLIIHRDLKPANILVTEDGEPRLLDFGIAKLLAAEPGQEAGEKDHTMTGLRLLTPDYASPEQVLGRPLSTATDVYSLGVILFRLLTGSLPYQPASTRAADLERAICETPPPRPGAVAGRKFGDLDNVVLMALRKEPDRRHASAEQLAEDVRRFQRGLPVLARPDTFPYRAGKFLARHRLPVAAALAATLLVAALVGFYTWRLAEERDRARQSLELLTSLFDFSDPETAQGSSIELGGIALSAREVLDRGARRLETLEEQPEVLAVLQRTTGRAYRSLALYDKARPLLEQSLAGYRRQYGDEHAETAAGLHELAMLELDQGNYPRAETLLRQALALRRRLWHEERPVVGENLNDLAVALYGQRRYDEAEAHYREALAVQQRTLGQEHEAVALTEVNLAALLFERGEYEAAEPLLRAALETQRRLLGDEHLTVIRSLSNLAVLLEARQDFEGARALFAEVLAQRRKIQGPRHPGVALAMNNLATTHYHLHQADLAEPLYRQALEIQQEVRGPDHEETIATLGNLANLLFYLRRDVAGAREFYRLEWEAQRRRLGDEHPLTRAARERLDEVTGKK